MGRCDSLEVLRVVISRFSHLGLCIINIFSLVPEIKHRPHIKLLIWFPKNTCCFSMRT